MPKIFKYEVIFYGKGKDLEMTLFFPNMETAQAYARQFNTDQEARGSRSRVRIVSEKEFKNEKH